MPNVEEVFRVSGIPEYTFVEPLRYNNIKVAVRTPGRCVVVEGPSGIGKTTVVNRLLHELGLFEEATVLSARKSDDVDLIKELPGMGAIGIVVVDDFHRLDAETKGRLSDFMKVLADSGAADSKLILIGINKAGDQLIQFAHDLGMRIDVFKLESNPVEKISQLISEGERALNVRIEHSQEIADRSQGSFHIAQVLCHNLCIEAGVTETSEERVSISLSADVVTERAMESLSVQFMRPAIEFARGSKIRPEGRAPYLHILKWLSDSEEWSLDIAAAMRANPELAASVGQVMKKGFLESLLEEKREVLGDHFHYQPETRILSVEDPKLIYFLRNIVWRRFTKEVGYTTEYFKGRYDIALSFAGTERNEARRLFEMLSEREVAVFYDENEQDRIIAKNIEDYLAPIYRSEANYVVPFLSPNYPTRIWTKFESDNFKERFGKNAVISIRFRSAAPGYFSDEQKYGSLSFDPNEESEAQLKKIADVLCARIEADRQTAS